MKHEIITTPVELNLPSAPAADTALSLTPIGTGPIQPLQWEPILEGLPLGIAVLEGDSGQTLWTNKALRRLLTAGVGMNDVVSWQPYEYLPNLEPTTWEHVRQNVISSHGKEGNTGKDDRKSKETAGKEGFDEASRLQFVHYATRNIAYWEWTVARLQETDSDIPHLLLTVQDVTDVVMNEKQLATAVRTAQLARRDAEALGNLTQLVNRSLTSTDLLRAIVHEAAEYFDTRNAAVLLLEEDGKRFKVGYSIGLQGRADEMEKSRETAKTDTTEKIEQTPIGSPPKVNRPNENIIAGLHSANTLAGKCIAERKVLVMARPERQAIQTPRLNNGKTPAMLISSPIQQNNRTYGVVEVYFEEAREIQENSLALLTAFADQTAVGLLKADLYEQIAHQRGQLQSIFDNAPVGILYFDAQGIAVTANAAAAHHYGHPVADMVGKQGTSLLLGLPPQVFEAALLGRPFHASHLVSTRKPGHEVVYDVSLVPLATNEIVTGLLLLTFEVTELVMARQEADAARSEAEDALSAVRSTQSQMLQMEKMRAVGELAQGIAHDINNALMAVLGYTELAEDDLDSPEALASHLATIKKAALDASSTVQRLNRFAKRGIATHGANTDINEVVKDVIQMTRPRWRDAAYKEGNSYQIETNLQPIPAILGEPSGLREVLINIVHNALNAMPHGGKLTLSTRTRSDEEVEIEIADTGSGMTPEVMSRIFDPFFTTRGVEGTGLGLAVSWTIIQRHGGSIHVESEPDQGTRFFIRLPISLNDAPPPVFSTPLPLPAVVAGIPVLVVDDEPIVSGVLSSILGRHGYRVTTANSATEALEKLNGPDADFRIVMTDHGMPGMNGLQLIAAIKRTHPDLPVLLLTGWGETVLENNVVEAMPDAVLGKPINQSDLLEALSKIKQIEPKSP